MRKTATRTLNGVSVGDFLDMLVLENELYIEWEVDTHDINAHNRLRGAMNVLAMCQGERPRMNLVRWNE